MVSFAFAVIIGGFIIAVILFAFYIFPNVICKFTEKEDINNGMQQKEKEASSSRNPIKEICAAIK
jgi:hypothetical protein